MGNPAPLKFGSCFDHLDRLIEAVVFSSGLLAAILVAHKSEVHERHATNTHENRTDMRREKRCEENKNVLKTGMRREQDARKTEMR